jgi:diguanylate cyclase (GGDEF)-like protein
VGAAQRLRQIVGLQGTVSRLGGDEFTIILPNVGDETWLAKFAEELLQALTKPFLLRGAAMDVGASIGLSVYPADDATVAGLLKDADLALYAAKALGRGQMVRFRPELRDQRGRDALK